MCEGRQILNEMSSGSYFMSVSHVKFYYTTCLSKETYIVSTDPMARKIIKNFHAVVNFTIAN